MAFLGKLLAAKERNTISCVNLEKDPTSPDRFTGDVAVVLPGTIVLCSYEYQPENVQEARRQRKPTTPYLFVLFNEKIWEATPHSYSIVQPSVLLHGKSVCFSGEGNGHRSYWRTLVESAGGTYVSAVSQSTSILVVPNGQYVSTKTAKAANYGTKIIYYTDFENFLNSA